jgi:hypothetical protein
MTSSGGSMSTESYGKGASGPRAGFWRRFGAAFVTDS